MITTSRLLIYINPFAIEGLQKDFSSSLSYASEYASYASYLMAGEGIDSETVFSVIPAECRLTREIVHSERFRALWERTCAGLSGKFDAVALLPSLGKAGEPDAIMLKAAREAGLPVELIDHYVPSGGSGFIPLLIKFRQGLSDSYLFMHVHHPRGERGARRK